MTVTQHIITIALLVVVTVLTRFLPFWVFSENRETPGFIIYIGKFLPAAVFSMLIVYCLRNVDFIGGNHGLPEIICILITAVLHLWKRQTLLSIGVGTISYMILIQLIR
ncbi:MAG: AzlD domain-containing protein [Eubacteriales bacterium]|nr:AzlD domain-containing protein [Eubacteriales bacterium]